MKSMYGDGYDPQAYALSKFPRVYALELHHWAEAAALTPAPKPIPRDKAITYWARAIGAARARQPGGGAQGHRGTRDRFVRKC